MKAYTKIITLLLILIAVTAIGCTDVAADEPVNEVSTSDSGTVSDVESSDDVVQFQLVQNQPIEVARDYTIYNEWHGRMKEILEDNKGNNVKIFSYNMQIMGDIVEVEEYFVILENDFLGVCYIDIDSINAITINNGSTE
ncbi:hypothetical protein [Methanococcoides sp. NM1]|uniref:hypothetical protein n=1 Tax=Methanococcoides sp. NM1 TaxID=1201013 RepID=UPI001083E2DA|nr:hypothetical protein [Methanococcoides sp. NM1]